MLSFGPLYFINPDSAVLTRKHAFYLPDWTDDVHYEVEVVIKIRKLGKGIQKKFAPRYYAMVGLGIDFTARDVQSELKSKGHPWEKAKGFDGSAVVSHEFMKLMDLGGDVQNLNFELKKWRGSSDRKYSRYDFSVDDLIVYLSKYMTLNWRLVLLVHLQELVLLKREIY